MKIIFSYTLFLNLISLNSIHQDNSRHGKEQKPKVLGIFSFDPPSPIVSGKSAVYRVVFSEMDKGVSPQKFSTTTLSGNAKGKFGINAIKKVSSDRDKNNVTIGSLQSDDSSRLDLLAGPKASTGESGEPVDYTLAKPKDVDTLNFTGGEVIKPVNSISTHAISTTIVSDNSSRAIYTMVAGDASGNIPFSMNYMGATGSPGAGESSSTEDSTVTIDNTPPSVVSINRQAPATAMTNGVGVVYRVTFNEKVTGVNTSSFLFTLVSGSVSGTVTNVTAFETAGTTYDVAVSSISGNGDIRLDLKALGTGISDTAGNAIGSGFTGGQVYTISQAAPSLTSVGISSSNATASLGKTGDIVTLSFTASEPINPPQVTIATHAVVASNVSGNNYIASYTMTASDVQGVVPFTIYFSNTAGNYGLQVTTTTNGSSVTFDRTAPSVTSINRLTPATAITNGVSVVYRVTFNEKVTGATTNSFAFTLVSGTVTGTVSNVTAVGTAGTSYNVTVSSLTGNGNIRLDLKASGTGINDAAGNAIGSGFTGGQVYTISQAAPTLTSVGIRSSNANASLAKTGDIITLSFSASTTINSPQVTIATHSVTATKVSGNNYTASYTLTVSDVQGVVPFTIYFSNTAGTYGLQVTTTTNGSSVTFDRTAPSVVSINRQVPTTAISNFVSVVYRVTFNEKVTGATTNSFAFTLVSGTVTGTVSNVAAVGVAGTIYDVTISSISGNGNIRLDLKASGTGINDAAGNAIGSGFTGGQVYTISQAAPTLTSIGISSSNATSSLAKTGDIIMLSFTTSTTINFPLVTIATHAVSASNVSGNNYTASYTMTASDVQGRVPFTINFSNTLGTAGSQVTTTTNGSSVTFDRTPPSVTSINRQVPTTTITNVVSVVYRVTFSEKVTGVSANSFAFKLVSGTVLGTVTNVAAVGVAGTIYDVTISSISGNGNIRLDLKTSGTGINDASRNAIASGFTGGQVYTISQAAPKLTSVGIRSSNATASHAKTGDIITLSFTASTTINSPQVTIGTHARTATHVSGNSYTASYTMTASDVQGLVPFTINFSNTFGTVGSQVSATTNGSSVTFDKTAPVLLNINRENPLSVSTKTADVVFRINFSEKVTGVDQNDFVVTSIGTASGLLAANSVTLVGSTGNVYDVQVNAISGNGAFRLDLKSTGTGINDVAGIPITTGFTAGQTYTNEPGFYTVSSISPIDLIQSTKDKPQAKVWNYGGYWWCVLSAIGGTKIFRLDGAVWTEIMTLNTKSSKPDCRVAGDLVHILMYKGASNNAIVYSIKYDPANNTYSLWDQRPAGVNIMMPSGSEAATLLIDGNGRMWVASDGVSDMSVWWSDAPYTTWSAPIIVATGAKDDDICALVSLPTQNKIGLFWSDQTRKLFGFKTHTNGTHPAVWSADEVPASASAINNIGVGFADDHMNLKVASDGTLYCAAKTGYNSNGYAKVILLVRRPSGVWDNAYTVTTNPEGTQPVVLLNEVRRKLKIVYATLENGGDIKYREASMDNIIFSDPINLISNTGTLYDYTTSTHQNYTSKILIMATKLNPTPLQAVSVLASDENDAAPMNNLLVKNLETAQSLNQGQPTSDQIQLSAYPNPVRYSSRINFKLPNTSRYELTLFDNNGSRKSIISRGTAKAGYNSVMLNTGTLKNGVYLVRIHTDLGSESIRVIINR